MMLGIRFLFCRGRSGDGAEILVWREVDAGEAGGESSTSAVSIWNALALLLSVSPSIEPLERIELRVPFRSIYRFTSMRLLK